MEFFSAGARWAPWTEILHYGRAAAKNRGGARL